MKISKHYCPCQQINYKKYYQCHQKVIKLSSTCVMSEVWDTTILWTYLITVIVPRQQANGLHCQHPCGSMEAYVNHHSAEKPARAASVVGL